MKPLLPLLALLTASCASSKLYDKSGNKIADLQGDMAGLKYSMAADGSVKLEATTVDHSSATLAQGEAAASKIKTAGAAVAASGLTLLLK